MALPRRRQVCGGLVLLSFLPLAGCGRKAPRAQVRQICELVRASVAQVLLVAVPELSLLAAAGRLSDHALYADIADELKIPLHRKGWSAVLAEASLRSDTVHANAAGYAEFAQGLVKTLRDSGFLVH